MSKKLKAAIIGLGVGEAHITGYEKHPGCEVAALCDIDPEKHKMVQEKYPQFKILSNPEDILTDPEIDVVSVASYDDAHFAQIMQAMKNGKHVFAEKPFCLYEAEARQIRALLKSNPHLRLSSNLILRASPRFQLLKKMQEEGALGELFYVEGDYNYGRIQKITEGWRGKIDFYSVVYGGGVHLIDLLMWLAGDRVIEVSAYGNQIASRGSQFKYSDMVVSILKFESGLIGKMAVNFGCVFPHFHPLNLYGTKATFINDRQAGWLFTSRDPQAEPQKITASYPGMSKGDLILSFINAILGNGEPAVSEEDVFAAMSVCFAIEKAHAEGRSVKVEYI